MSLVSLIIPVFNSGKSIHRCFDSLDRQTYKNLEIIFINDGSSDQSLALCRDYASVRSGVIVLDRPHLGQAAARNAGIAAASGEFIFFMDSDDALPPEAIELLCDSAQASSADLVIGAAALNFSDGRRDLIFWNDWSNEILLNARRQGISMDRQDIGMMFAHYLNNRRVLRRFCMLWGILFKTKIIKDHAILFDETVFLGDDEPYVFKYLAASASFLYLPNIVYEYYSYEGNTSTIRSLDLSMNIAVRNHRKKQFSFMRDYLREEKYPLADRLCKHALVEDGIALAFIASSLCNWLSLKSIVETYKTIKEIADEVEFMECLPFYKPKNDLNFFFIPRLIAKKRALLVMLCFKIQILIRNFMMRRDLGFGHPVDSLRQSLQRDKTKG